MTELQSISTDIYIRYGQFPPIIMIIHNSANLYVFWTLNSNSIFLQFYGDYKTRHFNTEVMVVLDSLCSDFVPVVGSFFFHFITYV